MVGNIGLGAISGVIHSYPTQAEAIRHVADAYNRTRLTPFVKKLFASWLAWRGERIMKGIGGLQGKPESIQMRDIPKPRGEEIPGGRGVLVRVLRVGVDGTDKEINAAEYGKSPPGDEYLVIGHESFGVVLEVGPNVTEFRPGDYVVATVRRPGGSLHHRIRMH